MFGFACTESEVYEKGSFMPAPIYFAHKILKVLAEQRHSGKLFDLQPDAKSQVTVQYVERQAGRLHQGGGLHPAQCRRPATARNTRPAWSRR